MVDVGKRIKNARKIAGLTQKQLAHNIHMSQSYLANIENNVYNPSIDTLRLIAEALNVDIAEFLGNGITIQETGLANDEIHLIMLYRNMNASDKSLIMQLSKRCSKKNVKSTPLMNYNASKMKVNAVGIG